MKQEDAIGGRKGGSNLLFRHVNTTFFIPCFLAISSTPSTNILPSPCFWCLLDIDNSYLRYGQDDQV